MRILAVLRRSRKFGATGRLEACPTGRLDCLAYPFDDNPPPRLMNQRPEDPVLTSARREALLVLAIWAAACAYSIGVCYRMGYNRDVATLTYVFGFPDWIFWGVVVPWTVCTVLCFVLSHFVIRDEDLGEEQSEEALHA
jgi:hypothetical protein